MIMTVSDKKSKILQFADDQSGHWKIVRLGTEMRHRAVIRRPRDLGRMTTHYGVQYPSRCTE